MDNAKAQFDIYVDSIIDSSVNGGVENVIKFISALKTIIDQCLGEMENERQEFNKLNSIPVQLEDKPVKKKHHKDVAIKLCHY